MTNNDSLFASVVSLQMTDAPVERAQADAKLLGDLLFALERVAVLFEQRQNILIARGARRGIRAALRARDNHRAGKGTLRERLHPA